MNPKRDERDRYIVRWFGTKWHEYCDVTPYGDVCSCGHVTGTKDFPDKLGTLIVHLSHNNPDLSTWPGFGWLWPKIREDENLWEKFLHWLYLQCSFPVRQIEFLINYIEPSNFADAVEGFLKSLGVKSYDEFLKGQKNESVT